MLAACGHAKGDDFIVSVRVAPRASQNAIRGVSNGHLQVRTTAPPADGNANQAVTRMLAKYLGVPASRIELLRGQSQRNKLFLVKGFSCRL